MNPTQLFDPASSTYTYILHDPATRDALIIDPVDEQLQRDLAVLRAKGGDLLMVDVEQPIARLIAALEAELGRDRLVEWSEDGTLHSVTERTRIETYENGVHFTEDGGASWTDLPGDTPVSMNLWGFGKSFLDEAEQRFAGWLTENLPVNPLKCEYFLPLVVSELIGEKKAAVKVLRSTDQWYGVTYREDKPVVVEAIARKTADGLYPENLWA